MGFDRAIRGGDGHAGEHETSGNLILVKERLVLLVDGTTDDLPCAGRAGTSPAGDRQIDVVICGSVIDRLIVAAVDCAVDPFFGIDERDFVGGHGDRSKT